MEAGHELAVVDLPDGAGGTVRAGLSTCYDLRFPELYRAQLDAGATVFVIPASWPMARVAHWTLLARARAVEDQCVVLACNAAGTNAGTVMGGVEHGRPAPRERSRPPREATSRCSALRST